METKANYVTVGIFTLAVILAAFGFVYWIAGIGERGETATLRVRIPGSASGLGRGSAVLFNGVKVGDVTRVFIDVQNPSAAIADTTIDRYTPITRSTEADIGLAGLTGQANIELKGSNTKEKNLLDEAEAEGKVAEINANPSAVTNLLETAQDIFKRADKVITGLEGFVGDNREPLTRTARNAAEFSDALARNAAGIDKFLNSVSQLSDTVSSVSGKLDPIVTSAQSLIKAVDAEKVRNIVSNAESFSNDLRGLGRRVDSIGAKVDAAVASAEPIVKSVNDTAQTLNEAAKQSQGTLRKVDGILDGVDPNTLRSALNNIEQTSRSANAAVANIRDLSQKAGPIFDNVGKVAQSFGNRAGQIDQLIADAGAIGGRLAQASAQVGDIVKSAGQVVTKADGLIGSVDPAKLSSALDNIDQTSRSANTAAANIRDLSQKAGPIFDNVGKVAQSFGDRAGQIDQLIADAGAIGGRLAQASTQVGDTVRSFSQAASKADNLIGSIDAAKVRSALDNIDQTSRSANTAAANIRDLSQKASPIFDNVGKVAQSFGNRAGQIDQLIADTGSLAGRLNEASTGVGTVVGKVNDILAGVDPNAVRSSVANIQQATVTANSAVTTLRDAAQTVSNVVNDVNGVTRGIAARKEQINQFVADASQLAGRLNAASVRVDGILQKVNDLLGSDKANGLVVEAADTLRSIRAAADNISAQVTSVAGGLSRFSNQGLSDVRGLVQDSQRAVDRIESAVDDLQRNPQRILTGGDGEVRRYNGRARR